MGKSTTSRKQKPYGKLCPLCDRKFRTSVGVSNHLSKIHTVPVSQDLALEILDNMVPGVPEYRRVIRAATRALEEQQELERIFRMPDRRADPQRPHETVKRGRLPRRLGR